MSTGPGLAEALRALARDGRAWVETGQVSAVEAHDTYGYLLTVTLPSTGQELQARPLWAMGGAQGEGIYFPIAEGDEVVVLCPGGDRNRAVALVGPPSGPSKPPAGWANDKIELVHAGGVEVRTAEGATVEAVVLESLLPDLKAALTEVQTALAGLGLPVARLTTIIGKLDASYRAASLSAE